MYYLGIAMNGEVIEFMLIDEDCHIHGLQSERNVDIIHDGEMVLQGVLESGIARVCLKANIKFEDIEFTCVAVPGFGEEAVYDELLKDLFRRIFINNNYICENEIEAAWTGALGANEGVVILAGVGSIAIGKNKGGETIRTGGWGRIAGDEGGEYWLARKVLEIYTKEADGRYNEKILYNLLKDRMNITSDIELFNFSFGHMDQYDISFEELVDILFEASELDDLHAKKILNLCAKEYILMIRAITKQIGFDLPINVSFIGRIFDKHHGLLDLIVSDFNEEFSFSKPQLSLVAGSALRSLMFRENVVRYKIFKLLQEEARLHQINS